MKSNVLEDIVSGAPAHLKPSIERLLGRPVDTREHILSELDAYTQKIDEVVRRRRDLDVNLAEGILQTCRVLLDREWAGLSEGHRRLVQLACDYYLDEEDGDGDLESVFGFDDDAEVLNLVLATLGRPELKLRI